MGRSVFLLLAAAALAGVLAWSLRTGDPEVPALPEFGGASSAQAGVDLPTRGGAGGDRIAIGDPAPIEGGGPAVVDPDRARESARIVVVGVPRSRRADASRFIGSRVEVSHANTKRPRIARLGADLRAVFERLDPVEVFEVVVLPADGVRTLVSDVRLAPGEERVVEVALEVGGTVFGHVLDAVGGPLPSATLMIRSESDDDEPTWRRRAILGEDGSFELRGIRPGAVWAELHAGAVHMEEELGAIAEAQLLGPIELHLAEGEALTGTVRWPDGAPAGRARVAASPRSPSEGPTRTVYAITDEEGRYRLEALARGPYELYARAGTSRDDLDGADGFRAWGEAQAPGTLDLTLERGLSISGIVVDDLGVPMPAFRVIAEQRLTGASPAIWRVSTESVSTEPGAFELRGLRSGAWTVTASDRGGVSVVEEEVQLAGDRDGLRLVLPRPARISGIVRDASGAGRAGRWVYAVRPPRDDGRVEPRAPRRALSQTDGVFTIDRVAPGRVFVGRSSDDPRALVLELAPGEHREDVAIELDD